MERPISSAVQLQAWNRASGGRGFVGRGSFLGHVVSVCVCVYASVCARVLRGKENKPNTFLQNSVHQNIIYCVFTVELSHVNYFNT